MAGAFQTNAFQNNAFQVDGVIPPTPGAQGGGGSSYYTPDRIPARVAAQKSLSAAIREALDPAPVVKDEPVTVVTAKVPKRVAEYLPPPLVVDFTALDLAPIADAVAALLAQQQALAAENAARLAAELALDDEEAMFVINMLLDA